MVWLVFPGIVLYFLIGALLSDLFRNELGERDLESAAWFLLWPLLISMLIAYLLLWLILSAIAYISRSIREIYAYLKPRKKNRHAR